MARNIRHGAGRGTYSEVLDVQEAADRVCEVAHLLERSNYNLDEVALVLSARGRPIDPGSVKLALVAVLTNMEHGFSTHKPISDDPVEIAHNAARALKRTLSRKTSRRSGAIKTGINATPSAGLIIAAKVLAGIPVTLDEAREFTEGSGLAALTAHFDATADQLNAIIVEAAPHASFSAIRTALEQVNAEAIPIALQAANRLLDTFFPADMFGSGIERDVAVIGCATALVLAPDQPNPLTQNP